MRQAETVAQTIDQLFNAQTYVTSSQVALTAGVTRQTAYNHLRKMVASGRLVSEGARRSSHYRLNAQRSSKYHVEGETEDEIWGSEKLALRLFAPEILDPGPVLSILNFAFTEMVNNAIDHSYGTTIEVRWFIDNDRIAFEVEDDGVGAFASIRESKDLDNDFQAVGELTKGKQTTAPDRHSGLGIFLTSRLVERFVLSSNDYALTVNNKIGDYAVSELPHPRKGTLVRCEIPLDTTATFQNIVQRVSDPVTNRLNRTSLRVELFNRGDFVSRTEAKLLGARLEGFEVVELDFTGVAGIGQGFADELFRVWQREHPDIRLVPVHANQAILAMIATVEH